MYDPKIVTDRLVEMLTQSGRVVSDDPFYKVTGEFVQVSGNWYAIALRFPEEVGGFSRTTARLIVDRYNKKFPDEQLVLNSAAHGEDIKYEGLSDWPHQSMILVVQL